MIILCVVAALVFLAVRLFRVCVTALAAVRVFLERRSAARSTAAVPIGNSAGPRTVDAATATGSVPGDPRMTSTGPQDAPAGEPWRPVRGVHDATAYPQDATTDIPAGGVERPAYSADVLAPQSVGRVVAQLAAVLLSRQRGATFAVNELPDGRLVVTLTVGREARPEASASSERTLLNLVPRPTAGPAYLGGRDDDAYLRGWDDGVDWVRQGLPDRAPSWSSAAYMTGWNDSLRAVAKARAA